MKTIKIFLASSDELKPDRDAFGNLVRRLDRIYEKRGVRIDLFEWEDYDAAYNNVPKQDEYDEQVRASDMFLALFHIKGGKFTIREFSVATEEFRNHASPKVFVYCKDLQPGEKESAELADFKRVLYQELGHYWCRYGNSDTMQLHFVMQLQLVENSRMDALKVEEDGRVTLDGMRIAHMDQLPFAAGNEAYQKMSAELLTLPDEIDKARQLAEKCPDNESLKDELQKKLNRYNQLKEEFKHLQENLFATAKMITSLQLQQVNARVRRAIEAFEAGDLERANTILEENACEAECHKEQLDQDRTLIHQDIDAFLLQAKTVLADVNTPIADRIASVTAIYAKADNWAQNSAYDEKKYAKLLLEYVIFCEEYSLNTQAKAVSKRLIDVTEKAYGTENIETAKAYNNVGNVCLHLDEFDKACKWFSKALEIVKQQYGENHPSIAIIYNNIGNVYSAKDDLKEALKYRLKAKEIAEKTGSDPVLLSALYNNIANVYLDQDRYDDALKYHMIALENRKSIFGETSREVAESYANIGVVYRLQGYFDDAQANFEKALAIRKAVLGIEHADTASSYLSIGHLYENQGKLVQAAEHYSIAISIYEKLFDPNHSSVAKVKISIGDVYRDGNTQEEYDCALNLYKDALNILLEKFDPNNFEIAKLYRSIGIVYAHKKNYSEALHYMGMALEIQENLSDVCNVELAKTYIDIGNVYYEISKMSNDSFDDFIAKSFDFLKKAISVCEDTSGLERRNLAYAYNSLGALCYKIHDFGKALYCFSKALSIQKEIFGIMSPELISSHHNIGEVYLAQEDFNNALHHYKEALEISKEVYEENNLNLAECYGFIGAAYQSMGDFPNAVLNFENQLKILESNNQPDVDELRECIEQLRLFIDDSDESDN